MFITNRFAPQIFVSVHSVGVKRTVGAALAQPCGLAPDGKLSSIGVLYGGKFAGVALGTELCNS